MSDFCARRSHFTHLLHTDSESSNRDPVVTVEEDCVETSTSDPKVPRTPTDCTTQKNEKALTPT